MANYDFSTLSPYDFEILCRDLFSKSFHKKFESFAPGRDKGKDLRCFISESDQIIVQCKHHKTFASLKSTLETELKKIIAIDPSRYILATTVDLTLENKDTIIEILSPYITSPQDIYGRSDINQLLTDFPAVERNHIKLWLNSVAVLEKVLHSSAYNYSIAEYQDILNSVQFYAINESLEVAYQILKKNRVLIISGIPGIGKTTLARMLALKICDEMDYSFVALNYSIEDGLKLYNESESQIFLFDDFLGTNFLTHKLGKNEDAALIQFINLIKKSSNKYLIFTTREYILNQAYDCSQKLYTNRDSVDKFILDIDKYSENLKARILYNHLSFSGIDEDMIANFVCKEHYEAVIKHPNYSPRLISTILTKIARSNNKGDLLEIILPDLENPVAVWLHPFKNDISKLSQIALLILTTSGTPVLADDLYSSLTHFFKLNRNYHQEVDEMNFKRSLNELESVFIKIELDGEFQQIITFENPGVADFLIYYLLENQNTYFEILSTAVFIDQFRVEFGLRKQNTPYTKATQNTQVINLIRKRMIYDYENLTSLNIMRVHYEGSKMHVYEHSKKSAYEKLARAIRITYSIINDELLEKYEQIFKSIDCEELYSNSEVYDLTFILAIFHEKGIRLSNLRELIQTIHSNCYYINDLTNLVEIAMLYPDDMENFRKNEPQFNPTIMKIIDAEIGRTNSKHGKEELVEQLHSLNGQLGLDLESQIIQLETEIEDLEREEEEVLEMDREELSVIVKNRLWQQKNEVNDITDLFNSLIH